MLASIMGPDLLIVVLVAALVLFGGTRIPKLARSLGSAQREFHEGLRQQHAQNDVQDHAEGHGTTLTRATGALAAPDPSTGPPVAPRDTPPNQVTSES